MKQYDNRFVVAVLICLKEIIFHISSYLNFCVCKYTNFLFSTVGRNIAANGSGLCDGGAIEAQIFNFALKFNRRTTVELCSFAPLLQNPC